jgi:hypothetical protein
MPMSAVIPLAIDRACHCIQCHNGNHCKEHVLYHIEKELSCMV